MKHLSRTPSLLETPERLKEAGPMDVNALETSFDVVAPAAKT